MNKKRRSYNRNTNTRKFKFKFSKGVITTVLAAAGILTLLGYAGIHSLIPVNGTVPVFAAPRNSFIKSYAFTANGLSFLEPVSGWS